MFSIKQNFEKDELKNRKNKIGLESGKEKDSIFYYHGSGTGRDRSCKIATC